MTRCYFFIVKYNSFLFAKHKSFGCSNFTTKIKEKIIYRVI